MRMTPAGIKRITVPTPFLVGNVNVYLLTDEQNVLIDTGPECQESWNALTAGLKDSGLKVSDIQHVLITHGHEDHYGLAGRLAEAGACIHLPENEYPERNTVRSGQFYRDQLVEAGLIGMPLEETLCGLGKLGRFGRMPQSFRPVAADARLPLGRSIIRAIPTPGHTPGHMAYLHESLSMLFSGDCIIPDVTPYPMLSRDPKSPGERFHGLAAYLKTFEELRSLDPVETCSGHRGCLTHLEAHIEKSLAFYELRQRRILSMLRNKGASAYEIAAGFYPGAIRLNHFLVVSEALSHLDYLESQARVRAHMQDGVRIYELAATGSV